MKTSDLEKHYGSPVAAQSALDISRQLYSLWKKQGIPRGRQCEIQVTTQNALLADPRKRSKR